jgi:hypothetical protein
MCDMHHGTLGSFHDKDREPARAVYARFDARRIGGNIMRTKHDIYALAHIIVFVVSIIAFSYALSFVPFG